MKARIRRKIMAKGSRPIVKNGKRCWKPCSDNYKLAFVEADKDNCGIRILVKPGKHAFLFRKAAKIPYPYAYSKDRHMAELACIQNSSDWVLMRK